MTDEYKDEIRDRMGEAFETKGDMNRLVPTDDQAAYGYPGLADAEVPEGVPLYRSAGAIVDAIRAVEPGDMVRVNGGSFYPAVEPNGPVSGEGFVYETPQGVRREVSPTNPSNRPPGTFDSPWIRRVPGYDSEGELHLLEVRWDNE